MEPALQNTSLVLLISGYIREKEEEFNLHMNIPVGIGKIIHELYPLLLFKFGDCDPKALKYQRMEQ